MGFNSGFKGLSKNHAVKMAYMDNWRSARGILELDAA